MASPKVKQALQQISASSEKQQGYEALLKETRFNSSPEDLPKDLIAIIDAIFADSLGIVATRSLGVSFVTTLKSVESNDTKIEVGEHALQIFQSQASSFEEQNAQIRELMATAHESDEDFLAAAKIL